ncbi:MAG: ABC transporter ATP-binding protein [Clostridia bacterium]|nr:ABC transporter ATP-binding protein [Clostridia bacterium]
MSTPVLQCENLKKCYRPGLPVLENLNLSLPAGKIIGLLGPNGCGKSTLIKLVSGLLVPDSGKILVCGEEQSEATNAYVSYLPERTYFNSWMRVEDLIRYFGEFYADFDAARARKMLGDMSIDPAMKLKQLSKGNKEKVQLILVMSRNARLYLLDEPIAGVDPAARDYILQTIIGNYNPESSVVITTHLIHDVEPVLEEFLFMGYGGRILRSGVADDVRAAEGKSLDELFREVFKYAP